VLLISAATASVGAENAQQATLSDNAKSDTAKPDAVEPVAKQFGQDAAAPSDSAGQTPSANQTPSPNQAQPKSLTDKAIEKVTRVAKAATDIFNRVPCLPPKGAPRTVGSLPRVAHKLAAGEPVVIIAFGSSSTQGYGASSTEFPIALRRNCSGNIRPQISPSSTVATAATMRPK
jgi:hypothetical protein